MGSYTNLRTFAFTYLVLVISVNGVLLYFHSPGGAVGTEAVDNFAAFDTHETTETADHVDKMADLTVNDTTLVTS